MKSTNDWNRYLWGLYNFFLWGFEWLGTSFLPGKAPSFSTEVQVQSVKMKLPWESRPDVFQFHVLLVTGVQQAPNKCCRMNEYPVNFSITNDLPLFQLPLGSNAFGRTLIFHQVEIVEGAFSHSIEILLPSKCCQFGSNKFILILSKK